MSERREVERHFQDKHFKNTFIEVEKAWVPGNTPGKSISPALLTLLKETVAEERRYPSKLTPLLCRQLSGRHLAVFKWQKKLKAGPARPHAIPHKINLAERPEKLLNWLENNSGKNLADLWKDILPADADDKIKRGYYHDLHWILNQGYALLMADGVLHLSKGRAPAPEAEQKSPETKKEKPAPENTPASETPQAEAASEAAKPTTEAPEQALEAENQPESSAKPSESDESPAQEPEEDK